VKKKQQQFNVSFITPNASQLDRERNFNSGPICHEELMFNSECLTEKTCYNINEMYQKEPKLDDLIENIPPINSDELIAERQEVEESSSKKKTRRKMKKKKSDTLSKSNLNQTTNNDTSFIQKCDANIMDYF
jgi:hypothetical protein